VLGAGSAVGIELNDFPRERFDEAAKCEARVALGLLPQSFVLGYVGRPVARKGFHRLLSAWEIVGLGRFGGTLLIAGCSEDDCRKAVGSVPAGVKALGYLTNLTSFYSACDAVTLPSDHEGFPYSLLEAAAAGRALHGTDIPGIRCAIVPGVTGLLYESGNMRDLANSLLRLSSDESLRNVLGKNARSRVERFFSRETIIQEYVSFYRDLCIFG
jgi:glycosyltransferase involved in cell wall biosynthesis